MFDQRKTVVTEELHDLLLLDCNPAKQKLPHISISETAAAEVEGKSRGCKGDARFLQPIHHQLRIKQPWCSLNL